MRRDDYLGASDKAYKPKASATAQRGRAGRMILSLWLTAPPLAVLDEHAGIR
jgi:hypothetical protein